MWTRTELRSDSRPKRSAGIPISRLLTSTTIDEVKGYIGNFKALIVHRDGVQEEFGAGVIIVATGAQVLKPVGLYGYDGEKVINQLELEDAFQGRDVFRPTRRHDPVRRARAIEERKYCSRICCMVAIKNAIEIKERSPETGVHILYRDIQAYGAENESSVPARQRTGRALHQIRPRPGPRRSRPEGRRVYHELLGREIESARRTWWCLSTPLIAGEDNEAISQLLRVSLDANKFFLEGHVKLKPLDFATDGIYLCGNAHYPGYGARSHIPGAGRRLARLHSTFQGSDDGRAHRLHPGR